MDKYINSIQIEDKLYLSERKGEQQDHKNERLIKSHFFKRSIQIKTWNLIIWSN